MPAAAVNAPFSPRAVRAVGALAVVSLVAAFALLLLPGDDLRVRSHGSDGFSRSAIGHRGLVALLGELGHDVQQHRVPGRGPFHGLSVLAEPDPTTTATAFEERLDAARSTLVVLPKHRGIPDDLRPGWVEDLQLRRLDDVQQVLDRLATAGDWTPSVKVRRQPVGTFALTSGLPPPVLGGEVQYLGDANGQIDPIVADQNGILLGSLGDIHVLADPDVLANHGLADNAEFVAAMFARFADSGPIAFDETVHGHALQPSLWHALGSYPLVLVPVHLLLLLSLVLWAAHGRFGPALPDRPAIAAGKAYLLDNIAELLATHRRGLQPSLRRYAADRLRAVAQRHHAPPRLDDRAVERWLDAWLQRRSRDDLRRRLADLLQAADDAKLGDHKRLQVARDLHQLTRELLEGGR